MRIYLRSITLNDGVLIAKWRNAPFVAKHCFDKTPVTLESNAAFYHSFVETGKYKQFIVERIDEDFGVVSYPISTVYLKDMDRVNHRCELCIFTSDDYEWNEESQSIAVRLLLEKAFFEYEMHKVYTYVFVANQGEISLMSRAGFVEEALLKDEALDIDGHYVDVIRMAVFVDNFANVQ